MEGTIEGLYVLVISLISFSCSDFQGGGGILLLVC